MKTELMTFKDENGQAIGTPTLVVYTSHANEEEQACDLVNLAKKLGLSVETITDYFGDQHLALKIPMRSEP